MKIQTFTNMRKSALLACKIWETYYGEISESVFFIWNAVDGEPTIDSKPYITQ